jgi:hypothetical protein
MLDVGGANSGGEWISQKKCFWPLSLFVVISMKNSSLVVLLNSFFLFFSVRVKY